MLQRIIYTIDCLLLGVLMTALITTSGAAPSDDPVDDVRRYTLAVEFDYVDWTMDAFGVKLGQAAIHTPNYFPESSRHQIVVDYMKLMEEIRTNKDAMQRVYTDPGIHDPEAASLELKNRLEVLHAREQQLAPLAEAILEQQLTRILVDLDLTAAGQPIPPVAFHVTPLPMHLVVSPRERIQEDAAVSLDPYLTIDRQAALEQTVDAALGVASLVVEVGGIGSYPTMVTRSTDLSWLSETIAHEWIHNWLTLRLLGLNYDTSPELRTMNETTASIAGNEIGKILIERYYPELAESASIQAAALPLDPIGPGDLPRPPFDYREEMHTTRVHVDELLAAGEVDAAEIYMEERRQLFWDNGYQIRKLNQAFFAFYGAYADVPGGAAGEDPVGPAVRALRAQSGSLSEFLKKIAGMTSFQELQDALAR